MSVRPWREEPRCVVVVWTATRDGHRFTGELWTHPRGVEARVTANGRKLTGRVVDSREDAEAILEAQRRAFGDATPGQP